MNNPLCYTPKCASCPVKDSCNSYVKPVTHIPMVKAPYIISDPLPYGTDPLLDGGNTWSDAHTYDTLKLVVY